MAEAVRETYRVEGERLTQERRARDEARAAAGMGFWRLVWIIALGILMAQVVHAGVTAIAAMLVKAASPA